MQQQSLYPSCNTTLETEPAHLQCTIFACLCSCRRLLLCTVIQSCAVQCTIFVCVQLPYIIFVFSCTQLCCAVHNFCLCAVAIYYICVQLSKVACMCTIAVYYIFVQFFTVVLCSVQYAVML